MPTQEKLKKISLALVCLLLTGFVYIYNTWSPSSYGHALKNHLGYVNLKPDLGKPRPIRSDEWAVVTPLTRATVNNNFERYNKTSLYEEDLRINYGLPIADWGMIFKPTMWLYGHVNPAYAYSFHWFCIFALFIIGYSMLFRQFGASARMAVCLSFGLYFTGFSQFWWNEKGPLFAIFPWVLIPFFLNIRFLYKLALVYYISVFWLLTNLYPPVQISLAFVGLIVLLATQPRLFRIPQLLYLLIAVGLAAGTAALYLYDYLSATSATLYPGGRNISGGGLPWTFMISWFIPGINFKWGYDTLIPDNICEIGTVGMYYYLSILVFLNYRNFPNLWNHQPARRTFIILLIGFLMQLAWMLLPIPATVGKLLLWNNVQPPRMQFAIGVLLTLLAFYVASVMGVVFSVRLILFLACFIFVAWLVNKPYAGWKYAHDLAFIPVIAAVFLIWRKQRESSHEAIIIASLVFGALLFGRFNPLQSAWPIFNAPPNELTKYFRELEKSNDGILAVQGLPGAVGNAMGYRSLSHVTAVPYLGFWRSRFPEVPEAELNQIFNRYSHIIPDVVAEPRLLQADAVIVPLSRFTKARVASLVTEYPEEIRKMGHFHVEKSGNAIVLNGWAGWKDQVEFHELELKSNAAIQGRAEFISVARPDLPLNTNGQIPLSNGFKLTVPFKDNKLPACLSLVARDGNSGQRTLLNNPEDLPYCNAAPAQ